MPTAVVSITSILASVLLFELGNSLLGVLIPYRAVLEQTSSFGLGALGAAYYLGFVAGCVRAGPLIHRIGHIRAFSALAAVAGASVMLLGLLPSLTLWLLLRTALGFCFAGMFVVVESWLNEITETARRGRVLAYYMITVWAATGVGKASFAVTEPDHLAAFALVSIAISLALVPVAMTAGITPQQPMIVRFRLRDLYGTAPVAVIGCFMTGASNGAFWMLAPVFAQARTDTQTAVALFMTVAVAGGALSQWPLGRLSDGVDRRWVIIGTTAMAALAAGLIGSFPDAPTAQLLALCGLFGVFALPIYALCIAHANDRMAAGMFVNASGQLLLLFGLGAAVGPVLAAIIIDAVGPRGLFYYIAGAQLLFAALTAARLIQHGPVPAPAEPFVIMPRTTPAAARLDPRADIDAIALSTAQHPER